MRPQVPLDYPLIPLTRHQKHVEEGELDPRLGLAGAGRTFADTRLGVPNPPFPLSPEERNQRGQQLRDDRMDVYSGPPAAMPLAFPLESVQYPQYPASNVTPPSPPSSAGSAAPASAPIFVASTGVAAPDLTTTAPVGIYSASGFDLLGVLVRVAQRPNPKIDIGPVDFSCSFLVSDVRLPDMPVVYVSDTFEKLTGFTKGEILGRNCRFLQSPDGQVVKGSMRQFCDNGVVYDMKVRVAQGDECQFTLINYKKSGEPFINLVTVIPICWDTPGEVTHYVGLQVDMVEQPRAILERMQDGSYSVNYQIADQIRAPPTPDTPSIEAEVQELLNESPPISAAAAVPSSSGFDAPNWTGRPPQLSGPSFLGQPYTFSTPDNITSTAPASAEAARPVPMNSVPSVLPLNTPSTAPSAGPVTEMRHTVTFPPPPGRGGPVAGPPAISNQASKSLATLTPSTPSSTSTSTSTSTPSKPEDLELAFYRSVIENSDELLCIVSLRGRFLYASRRACRMSYEYDPSELVGRSLGDFVHPGDMVSVMRDLRNASIAETVQMVFRFRRKRTGYVWVEVAGHIYEGETKRTKCFILCARPKTLGFIPDLDRRVSASPDGEFWCKLSPEGHVLYTSSACAPAVGVAPDEILERRVTELVDPASKEACAAILKETSRTRGFWEGGVMVVEGSWKGRTGVVPVVMRFWPGGRPNRVGVMGHSDGWGFCFLQVVRKGDEGMDWRSMAARPGGRDVYGVLDQTRVTSLNYEVSQLRLVNRRLQDELPHSSALGKRARAVEEQTCSVCSTTVSSEWAKVRGRDVCKACAKTSGLRRRV
ncbi:hypothetical protein M427DRAFT_153942 [Gonapodya prolifera JEL478]|uniref:PAS domain-containing protein n=1 Tax=Gonapodya prolifera (strain JEL478) TaxID=1344416 RepID=A0A139AJZ9_GONPJ|nr:hypothetical protein M427DRAFT_153942 [Gonapodya prolifera JEL478]|eukprot:KXS17110.1 hypothetical protein M427DRAFT_153942 [Gonapodya prolifera JEL478]